MKGCMKFKVKHKTEGWTGELEILDEQETGFSSHACYMDIKIVIYQDSHKPNGEYVEDPEIDSLDELELLSPSDSKEEEV